jgi:hypothetical protein
VGFHSIRNCGNCENIAHVNKKHSPIQQLLHGSMDNNEQQLTYVNDLHSPYRQVLRSPVDDGSVVQWTKDPGAMDNDYS